VNFNFTISHVLALFCGDEDFAVDSGGESCKSSKEFTVEKAANSTRECKACHKYDGHDSRNCPLNPKSKAKAKPKPKS